MTEKQGKPERISIKLMTGYKLYNGGEIAGFGLKEAKHILDKGIGVLASDKAAEVLEEQILEEETAPDEVAEDLEDEEGLEELSDLEDDESDEEESDEKESFM